MHLWGDERRGSRVRTMSWLGSHHAAVAVWHIHWWRSAMSGFSLHLGVRGIWSPCLMAIDLKRVARSLWHVHWWRCATSGSSFHLGWKVLWSPCLMAHLLEEGCNACLLTSMELVCLGSGTYCLRCFWAPTCLQRYCLGDSFATLLVLCGFQCMDSLWKSASFTCCWRGCESRG